MQRQTHNQTNRPSWLMSLFGVGLLYLLTACGGGSSDDGGGTVADTSSDSTTTAADTMSFETTVDMSGFSLAGSFGLASSSDSYKVKAVYSDRDDIDGVFDCTTITSCKLSILNLPKGVAFAVILTDKNNAVLFSLTFNNQGIVVDETIFNLNYDTYANYLQLMEATEQAQYFPQGTCQWLSNVTGEWEDATTENTKFNPKTEAQDRCVQLDSCCTDDSCGKASGGGCYRWQVPEGQVEIIAESCRVRNGTCMVDIPEQYRNIAAGVAYSRGANVSEGVEAFIQQAKSFGVQVVQLSGCDEMKEDEGEDGRQCFINQVENARGAEEAYNARKSQLEDVANKLKDALQCALDPTRPSCPQNALSLQQQQFEQQFQSNVNTGDAITANVGQFDKAMNNMGDNHQDYGNQNFSQDDLVKHQTTMQETMGPDLSHKFGSVSPIACKNAGYQVANYIFSEQWTYAEDEAYIYEGPQIDFKDFESEDSTEVKALSLAVTSKHDDGSKKVEVFNDIKIRGSGNTFKLTGLKQLTAQEIKEKAGAEYLRDILDKQNTGNTEPPMPDWQDAECDPLKIANEILTVSGRSSLQGEGFDPLFQGRNYGSHFGGGYQEVAYCPEEGEVAAGQPKSLEAFCYNNGDKATGTLKTTAADFAADLTIPTTANAVSNEIIPAEDFEMAAIAICQAAFTDDAKYDYQDWNGIQVQGAKISCYAWHDASGREIAYDDHDTTKEWWCGESCTNCAPKKDGSKLKNSWGHTIWGTLRSKQHNMKEDCSLLRLANAPLIACQWLIDIDIEEEPNNFLYNHPPLWEIALKNVDKKVEKHETDQKLLNKNFVNNDYQRIQDTITRCSADFDRQNDEAGKRVDYVQALLAGIEKIKAIKDPNDLDANNEPKLKYITDETTTDDLFADTYGKMNVTSLEGLVTRLSESDTVESTALNRLKEWQASLTTIADVYTTLDTALNKAFDPEEADKCVAKELKADNFKPILKAFKEAYEALNTSKKKAYNHAACLDMDEYIFKIRELITFAPSRGIKDRFKEYDTDSMFLTTPQHVPQYQPPSFEGQGECDGFWDYRNECVEEVTCDAPSAEASVLVLETLLAEASIKTGCDSVVEKLGVIGTYNELSNLINGIPINKGEVTAKVLLMTNFQEGLEALKKCFITLKVPMLTKDGCWEYTDEVNGTRWSKLSKAEQEAATTSDYKLGYVEQKINMKKIAERKKMSVKFIPRNLLEYAHEKDDDEWAEFYNNE